MTVFIPIWALWVIGGFAVVATAALVLLVVFLRAMSTFSPFRR